MIAEDVKEYCEDMPVHIKTNEEGIWIIEARNEGGYNATQVDLLQLLQWVEKNKSLIFKEK
jgi:hypothetical protein